MTMREALSKLKVLVVGDVMLDEYWFGDVRRISPEAPVPVVRVERGEERPGGAANVARNVAALGARATLLSVVGKDDTARRLRNVLDESGIEHVLQEDDSIRTTLKLRVIGHQQQMLRIDFERPPSREALDAKLSQFGRLVEDSDVVVFSDYRKGALDRIKECLSLTKDRPVVTVVDPKGRDYSRYAGAKVLTPNRAELAEVEGPWDSDDQMDEKAEDLRREIGVDALLLTLSEQGMKLYSDEATIHRPAQAREVYDVSGAGDTVVAAVAVMRGVGAPWEETIDFANAAAGIVVSRLGTSAATLDEVLTAMHPAQVAAQ
jgi:rfaE bifunctional protein kinase chain/domain